MLQSKNIELTDKISLINEIDWFSLRPRWIKNVCYVKLPTNKDENKIACNISGLIEFKNGKPVKVSYNHMVFYKVCKVAVRLLCMSGEQRAVLHEKLIDQLGV